MNHVQKAVMEALLVTPLLLDNTQRLLAIYKHKETLISLCRAVYLSILEAVGQILYYQRQKTTKQIIKAVLTPGTFERKLLQKIEAIMTDRDALNAEVDLCQKEAMAQATAAGNAQIRDAVHAAIKAANRKYSHMVHKIQGNFNVFMRNPVQVQDHQAVVAKTRSRKTTATEPQTDETKHLVELMTGCMLVPHTVQALCSYPFLSVVNQVIQAANRIITDNTLDGLAGAIIREPRFPLLFPINKDKEGRLLKQKDPKTTGN